MGKIQYLSQTRKKKRSASENSSGSCAIDDMTGNIREFRRLAREIHPLAKVAVLKLPNGERLRIPLA